MRTLITKGTLFTGVVLITLFGCNKKKETQQVLTTYEDDITSITDKTIAGMDSQEVFSDNKDMPIYMLDDGIGSDFLIGESDLAGTDSARSHIRDHSFIACLKGLSLTESQKTDIYNELKSYNACKEKAVARAKTIYHDLQVKYKASYTLLYNAFIAGTISVEKFKSQVAELRIEFKKELRALQLKEKLDETFKICFRKFLTGLHQILTEQQWKAFITCCKQ